MVVLWVGLVGSKGSHLKDPIRSFKGLMYRALKGMFKGLFMPWALLDFLQHVSGVLEPCWFRWSLGALYSVFKDLIRTLRAL